MQPYQMTDQQRDELGPYRRAVQYIIAVRANEQFGIDVRESAALTPPRLIGGGVFVNGRQIHIYRDAVEDAHHASSRTTPEEKAAARAIRSLLNDVDAKGIALVAQAPETSRYPLLSMFRRPRARADITLAS